MVDTSFDTKKLEEEEENFEFTVNEWQNKPKNNVLDKGRYLCTVKDISPHIASSGNNCAKITMVVEGKYLTDFPIISDSYGKKHKMSYKWLNFLFAIGVRNTNKQFKINKSQIVNQKCLIDVNINKEGNDNNISGYSPIEEETAPIKDVPPENQEKIVEAEVVSKPDGQDDSDL